MTLSTIMLPSLFCFLSTIVCSSSLEQIREIAELEWNNSVVGFDEVQWDDPAPKVDLETNIENQVPVIESVLETVTESILPLLESVKRTPFQQTKTETNDSLNIKLPFNFSWLIPGLLAGTNCPTTEEELLSIYETGVRYLITLSPEYQPKHHQLHPPNLPDFRHHNIFFDDFTAPSLESIIEFEKICREARREGASMAVHCRWGYGRTGTMLALYLVTFLEMSPEDALLEVRHKRPWSVETKEQEQAIEDWGEFLRERYNLETEKLKNIQQNQYDNVQYSVVRV